MKRCPHCGKSLKKDEPKKKFKGWIAVRDEDDDVPYWYVTHKDFWEKHYHLSDKVPYIDIPGFSEAMEHCHECTEDMTMDEQEAFLISLGFEIRPNTEWFSIKCECMKYD